MRARLISLILRCLAVLPLPLIHTAGSIIGRLLMVIPNDYKRISAINLRLCFPELNRSALTTLLRDSLIESAKTLLELGPLWFWQKDRLFNLVKSTTGEEILDSAMKSGKGAIIAAPHLGAWELVGLYCSARYPMTNLYRPPRLTGIDVMVKKARARFGATMVATDIRGIRILYKALEKGELIGILPDQEPGQGNGEFIPFFGIPAYTMTLMSRLAARSEAMIIYTYAERLPSGSGYHLHFIPSTPDKDDTDNIPRLLKMNRDIETCVKKIPAQYQWGYKRFRKRPEGEKSFY